MKLYVKNTLTGLVPMYGSDYDEKKRLKLGEEYEVSIRRPRNIKFHKLFFALLNLGHQNTQMELPFETYRRWAVMKAGFVKVYNTPKGQLFEPESIAFANMDEDRFRQVYDRVLDVIVDDIGTDREDIMLALNGFM